MGHFFILLWFIVVLVHFVVGLIAVALGLGAGPFLVLFVGFLG
jgi:hypothetical protein